MLLQRVELKARLYMMTLWRLHIIFAEFTPMMSTPKVAAHLKLLIQNFKTIEVYNVIQSVRHMPAGACYMYMYVGG